MSHMGVFYDKEIKQIKDIFAEEAVDIVESICQLYTAYETLSDQLEDMEELLRTLAEELKNVRDKINTNNTIHDITNTNQGDK